MGGHSHWAGIKHKKAILDSKRGKIFTRIIREITIAAKMGGGKIEDNPRLRKAVEDAKAANMPADNVKRAIMKGTGQLEGASYEEITYEGYGPGSIAVIVECTTDNKNRTFSEVRKIFTSRGGSIGTTGCVSYMFKKKGLIIVSKEAMSEDDLMNAALEAGADDVKTEGDSYQIFTAPESLDLVKKALEEKNIKVESANLTMIPDTETEITDPNVAQSIMKMMDELDDHDDTKDVYSNYNIPDEIMEKLNV
ncbi:YebC/PmpR family DNA-binding regulatory protein [Elusimicrobium simillimum]|uniref:YebC/PmpR family DNA-binding transcriptional regulator n=1 Tax=Elusimicrobium simillimum TaxID=3143438 RepID=UPI003C6F0317